jgi:hemolysin activation/secretion protein
VPPTAEPGRAEEQLRQPPEPQPARSSTVVPPLPQQTAPPGSENVKFTLQALSVEGATVYSSETLTAPYSTLLGQELSLARLYALANEMTARYRNDGYLLSSVVVPAQTVSEGKIRLQAVEGYLAAVEFEGELENRRGMYERIRQRLLAQRPLRTATLERQMLLLNDLPGVSAQAVLQPAQESGAANLTVRVGVASVAANVGATNRGSEVQGPVQYDASLDLRSLLTLHDATTLRYLQSSERDELWLAAVSHTERLSAQGLDWTLAGSVSRSSPELGEDFAELNLETDTDQASMHLAYPFVRSRTANLRGRLALTYHDGLTDSEFGELSRDVISAVRVGLSFDTVDAWRGVNLIDLEYSRGIGAFGSSEFGDPFASRIGGEPEFSKATLYIARLQSLAPRFSVLLAASGQAAFDNLLAPEEFAFGGEFYGRAYDPSEVVGDSGAAGKVELRFTVDNPGSFSVTLYGFYETGYVWRKLDSSEAGAADEDDASSAGGGVRFNFGPYVSGYVEGAVPLDHIVAAEGNDDARVFGGIKVSFGQ